jgi:hypothetical protein
MAVPPWLSRAACSADSVIVRDEGVVAPDISAGTACSFCT